MEFVSTLLLALAVWLAGLTTLYTLYTLKPSVFKRVGIEVTPIALLVKKSVSLSFAERIPPRIIRVFTTASIVVMAYLLVQFYVVMLTSLVERFSGRLKQPLIVPLVPGVTISVDLLFYIIPSVAIAMLVHELAHGIAARGEGIPVRSTGFALILGVLPAAFIEPDEEEFRRRSLTVKARVLAAGVAANLLVALLVQAIIPLLSPYVYLEIIEVKPGSPAYQAGLQPGDKIVYVNSTRVHDVEALRSWINASNTVNITVERGGKLVSILVKPRVFNETGLKMIGVTVAYPRWLYALIWVYIVNYSLALINAAPLVITDGAKILNELFWRRGLVGKSIAMVIQAFTILLVASNAGFTRLG